MKQEYHYQINNEIKQVTVELDGEVYRVTVGENSYEVTASMLASGLLDLTIDGLRQQANVITQKNDRYVNLTGHTWQLERLSRRQARRAIAGGGAGGGQGNLQATMPGQVLDVLAAPDDVVERGQTLVLLEAMKMEIRIAAPHDGVVKAVHCTIGQVVERGQVLVEVEAT